MADLSKIRLNNTNYNLKDKQVRDFLKGSFLLNSHFDSVGLSSIDPEEYGAYTFADYIALVHYETYSDRNTWTYFYSSDDHNWSFRSLDGQFLIFYPPNNIWIYFENWDGNLQLDPTDGISQLDNDFPEIQIGYRIPESVIGFSIHQITGDNYSSELTFSEIDELFNLNCKIIAARTDSYSYPPRNTTFYYVNTTRYRPNEGISFHEFKTFPSNIGTIWYLKIYDLDPDNPEHDELPEVTITELDLHEPEDDEDVDDMLESLDLTVIDDDNLVGSAEIGSGNVVNWNPAKQVSNGSGGLFIVDISETYNETTHETTFSASKTYAEINEALANGNTICARYISSMHMSMMYLTAQDEYSHYFDFKMTEFVGNATDGYFINGYHARITQNNVVTYSYAEKAFYA